MKNVNIHSTDFKSVNSFLKNIDWQTELKEKTPTDCYLFITEKITEIVTMNSKPKRKSRKVSLEYRLRRVLWRKRRKLVIKLSKEPINPNVERKVHDIEKEIRDLYEKEEKRLETEAIHKIESNSKYFYSYAKRTVSSDTSIIKMEDKNGNVKTNREDICNILQDQYVSVFESPCDPKSLKNYDNAGLYDNESESRLSDIDFSAVDIGMAINDIPMNSAPGPDGITPKILKECKETVSYPLYLLWKKSLDTGIIPNPCKLSYIVPIHKKGRKDKPENYRPISLTSQLIKLFERVLKNHLVNHLESNDLIGSFQHGFRNKRSCLTQSAIILKYLIR